MGQVLKITHPYYNAWADYHWKQYVAGIGIDRRMVAEALKNQEDIYLYVRPDPKLYRVSPQKIIDCVKKYNSSRMIKTGFVVGIIPQSVLEEVEVWE